VLIQDIVFNQVYWEQEVTICIWILLTESDFVSFKWMYNIHNSTRHRIKSLRLHSYLHLNTDMWTVWVGVIEMLSAVLLICGSGCRNVLPNEILIFLYISLKALSILLHHFLNIMPLITIVSTTSCIHSLCQAISPVHAVMPYSTSLQNAIPYVQFIKHHTVPTHGGLCAELLTILFFGVPNWVEG